ncbi:MAG TPA: ParA family protein [Anaerolineales bacterium]|jgi:chromosome partitioning protein|nr:ParA family protein [Anaerolineales bacterium]
MTYFIAVANQKGGVAKTTTAVSLGGALVENGQEVLLVDLDPQGDLTLSLGFNPADARHAITDVLFNWASPASASRETKITGLDLIPSNPEMELAERFLPIRKNFESILRSAVSSPLNYDYVIFDCPPSVGAITTNALNAADLLIIPTLPEFFSVYALRNVLGAYRRVRSKSNPNLVFRILITMQDLRNRIHRDMSVQLKDNFSTNIFENIIQIDTKLRESSVAGLPITKYAPMTRSAEQYAALSKELIEYVKQKYKQPA